MRFDLHSIYVAVSLLLASPLAGMLIGSVLPLLIAVFQKPKSPKWVQCLVMLGICFVASLQVILRQEAAGPIPPERVPQIILETIGATILAYHGFWKNFGLGRFEAFTSSLTVTATDAVKTAFVILGVAKTAFKSSSSDTAPADKGTVNSDGK